MADDGAVPTKPQIERQLLKMLENSIFTTRPQQAKLLQFLVENTLKNEEVTEEIIRQELYPPRQYLKSTRREVSATFNREYEEGSNVVRRTVGLLRKSLLQYYDENKMDSLVIIHLPEQPPGRRIKYQAGEAYKPKFAYSASHDIHKDYLLGCRHMQSGFINDIPKAVDFFTKVLDREPEHAAALLYLADALSLMVGFAVLPERNEDMLRIADKLIDKAALYPPIFWHTHSARAMLHFCRGEFDAAHEEFEQAMRLDRGNTEAFSHYCLFLAASGDTSKALQLVELAADEQFNNPSVHVIHGMHLAAAGRFEEGEQALQRALDLDRNCWTAHLGLMRLHMSWGKEAESQEHAERLRRLLDPDEYEHWMALAKRLHNRA